MKLLIPNSEVTSVQRKIFISHAHNDQSYVKIFVDKILRLGLGVPNTDIFCTSAPGMGISLGEEIPNVIKANLRVSKLVILMISKSYRSSPVCLNEMGAAWALFPAERIIPILLPGSNYNDLDYILSLKFALKSDSRGDLARFTDVYSNIFNKKIGFHISSSYIEEYLRDMKQLLIPSGDQKPVEGQDNKDIYGKYFEPLRVAFREVIPEYNLGLIKINEDLKQEHILKYVSTKGTKGNFRCYFDSGDNPFNRIKRIEKTKWLVDNIWELQISEFYVYQGISPQKDFIIFKILELDPFQIDSDIGGTSYEAGVLLDGRIISLNEYYNGAARFSGKVTKFNREKVSHRWRYHKGCWVILASEKHNVAYNFEETEKFLEKLDKSKLILNEDSVKQFIKTLKTDEDILTQL